MASATNTALAIPEILERILLTPNVHPKDVCAVQRSNRLFDAIITTSAKLRRKARSPANRVFANSKILEKILLEHVENSAKMFFADEHFKTLFVLQRVNKKFRDTIRGSLMLQRSMWRVCVGPLSTTSRQPSPLDRNPLMYFLSTGPFQRHWGAARERVIVMNFDVTVSRLELWHKGGGKFCGVQPRDHLSVHGTEESWAQMRMFPWADVDVQIKIHVAGCKIPPIEEAEWTIQDVVETEGYYDFYTESSTVCGEEATMGRLFAPLESLRYRRQRDAPAAG